MKHFSKRKVLQSTLSGKHIKIWSSASEAARYFNTSQGCISNAARGERPSFRGFKLSYIEEDDSIPNEIWKSHPNLPIHCSNFGRIRHINSVTTMGSSERNGYRRVKVGGKTYSCHRLIAESWFPEEKENVENTSGKKAEVNHKNRNRSDNSIDNLEWVTPSRNVIHRYESK